MSFRSTAFLLTLALCTGPALALEPAPAKIKTLIIDGQNNHGHWPKTTVMMKQYLEDTGLFTVDIERTAFTWQGAKLIEQYPIGKKTTAEKKPKADPNFKPDFSKYQVVITNFGWGAAHWPQETKDSFLEFIKGGGGLVVVHAANNSFGDWPEYNKIIGLGGWGGRNEKHGPYVYYNDKGEEVRDNSPGRGGSHGPVTLELRAWAKRRALKTVVTDTIFEVESAASLQLSQAWRYLADAAHAAVLLRSQREPVEAMRASSSAQVDGNPADERASILDVLTIVALTDAMMAPPRAPCE